MNKELQPIDSDSLEYRAQTQLAMKDCTGKTRDYVYLLLSGVCKQSAMIQLFGEKWRNAKKHQVDNKHYKIMSSNNKAGHRLYSLMTAPMMDVYIADYQLGRQQRAALLSNAAALCYREAENSVNTEDGFNTSAINQMVRAVNELNKMTGEHAAQEINVKSKILQANLSANLNTEQATDMYLQVMRGGRIDSIETELDDTGTTYQPVDYSADVADVEPEPEQEQTDLAHDIQQEAARIEAGEHKTDNQCNPMDKPTESEQRAIQELLSASGEELSNKRLAIKPKKRPRGAKRRQQRTPL